MRTIPLAQLPLQSFSVVLNERNVNIALRSIDGSLYIDVACEGRAICAGQLCTDRTNLTARAPQLGFPDLTLWFADLRGTSDPYWQDLGTRFILVSTQPVPPTPEGPFFPVT